MDKQVADNKHKTNENIEEMWLHLLVMEGRLSPREYFYYERFKDYRDWVKSREKQ